MPILSTLIRSFLFEIAALDTQYKLAKSWMLTSSFNKAQNVMSASVSNR